MRGQSTAVVRTEAVPSSQLVGSIVEWRGSEQQYRRIVKALRDRRPERRIAQDEGIDERLVREVRGLEYERQDSYLQAVGMSVGGLMDRLRLSHQEAVGQFTQDVRHLHKDIDKGIFDDLRGAA